MKLLVAGGTGFISKKLSAFLLQRHHHSVILSHHPNHIPKLFGNTVQAISNISQPCDSDYFATIINPTGAGIIAKHWSQNRKKERLQSRLQTTEQQLQHINSAKQKQAVRSCIIDTGLVLAADGSFPKRMLPAVKMRVGECIAAVNQWMSWIHYLDYLNIIGKLFHSDSLQGNFNVTPPHPLCNAKFSQLLSQQLHRLTIFPFPVWLLNIVPGQMAERLIGSPRLMPVRLEKAGLRFNFTSLEKALNNVLIIN